MFATHDRTALRAVFLRAWQRHLHSEPLEGVERLIVQVALRHPEYHAALNDPQARERDYLPAPDDVLPTPARAADRGPAAANPFLHMGMHIAIEEQLALDQPGGIRRFYQSLRQQLPDDHAVQHRMMECLAEAMRPVGAAGGVADERRYRDCVARLVRARP